MSDQDHRAARCRCITKGARGALLRILTVTNGGADTWRGGVRWLARDLGTARRNARRYVDELRTEPGLWLAGDDPLAGQRLRLEVCGPSMCRWECAGMAMCEVFVTETARAAAGLDHMKLDEIEVRHGWTRPRYPGRRRSTSWAPGQSGRKSGDKNGPPSGHKNGPLVDTTMARSGHNNGPQDLEGAVKASDVGPSPPPAVSTCGRTGCSEILPCRKCRMTARRRAEANRGDQGDGP